MEKRPLHILVGLINPAQAGGIYVTEKRFLEECAEQPDVSITTFQFGSRSPSETRLRRVFRLLVDIVRYAALLRREKPDIVHINSAFDKRALLRDVWYALVSRLFGRVLFIKFHGSDANLLRTESRFWKWLTAVTLRNVPAIGVLSNEEKSNFVAAGYPEEMFSVLKNVVDWQRFAIGVCEDTEPFRLLFIARFVRSKGVLDVIRATRLVLDSGREVELRCVGDGPELKAARAMVAQLGLERKVVFDGWVPELETTGYYLSSTILVLPTESEGFSMAIFQAVAAGLPVITTKIRAAGEYLKEPDNCLWITPKNPSLLAEKIIYLLDHPEVRKAMARSNRGMAQQFPARETVLEYIAAYKKAIEHSKRRKPTVPLSVSTIRILFNSPDPRLQGGPATHIPLLERELRKQIDLRPYHYGRRTDTETLTVKFFGRLKDLMKLHLILRSVKPDLIHHNSAFDRNSILRDAPLAVLTKLHRVPLFVKIHGSASEFFEPVNPMVALARWTFLRNSTTLGVLSTIERDEFTNAWPVLRGRVEVVKNIIKDDFRNIVRHESPHPSILFISRFVRRKGMFDLLHSVPRVLSEFPQAAFTFIGSGPDEDSFCAEVREMQLAKSVRWFGHLGNIETTSFYSSAWVFVFPTQYPEGMPMVVAEAMAAGVPIVTTRTRFSRAYMQEGKHCLYVESQNPNSIAEKILILLRRPELRKEMSANNKQFALPFCAKQVAAEYVDVYRNITANHPRRSRRLPTGKENS